VDDEKEAKEWHTKHGPPPPAPETPKAIEKVSEEAPKGLGNPWTKSITKGKPKPREVSDEDETGGPSDRNVEAAELSDFEDADPSTTRFATPGQTDRSKNAAESLPTPDTGGHALGVASGSRSRPSRGDSPPPQLEDAIILRNERTSSLSAEVLELIRSERSG
jgi:hypothetical protein